jgi:hypothetical protein
MKRSEHLPQAKSNCGLHKGYVENCGEEGGSRGPEEDRFVFSNTYLLPKSDSKNKYNFQTAEINNTLLYYV